MYDDGYKECGFEENGFWYSDVSRCPSPSLLLSILLRGLCITYILTERHRNKMDHLGCVLSLVLWLVYGRIYPRQEEVTSR